MNLLVKSFNGILVPDFAINSMQLFTGGDPIFGQNAIGGAISLEMKMDLTLKVQILLPQGFLP